MKLADLPESLVEKMEGPRPPEEFESDGCTGVWDYLIAVDCRPACFWHDHRYGVGGCKRKRLEADLAFYRNLRACDLGKPLATVRYLGVRLFGWRHFAWK